MILTDKNFSVGAVIPEFSGSTCIIGPLVLVVESHKTKRVVMDRSGFKRRAHSIESAEATGVVLDEVCYEDREGK